MNRATGTPTGHSDAASALSPEAERLAAWCDRLAFEADADGVTVDAREFAAIARLLRSPVASTTLPREPSEAAIEAAAKAVAVNDGWREHSPLTKHVAFAKGALRAAYAVDGSPVASLAPTSLAEMWLREQLWLRHGHRGIYGDDGEMQCGECRGLDFKRDSIERIRQAMHDLDVSRMAEAARPPKASE